MLDGKRYYAVFPDENPELRRRIRAVLDALANVNKAFRRHFEAFQPKNLGQHPPAIRGTKSTAEMSYLDERPSMPQ
jgi:hypothetical protein